MSSRYQRQDRFFKKAKADKFVARSVYKLEELDQRYSLFKKNQYIVDLGCSPGSWLQYLNDAIGRKGALIGYDIVEPRIQPSPRTRCFVADVKTLTKEQVLGDLNDLLNELHPPKDDTQPVQQVSAVVSDMAPKLTGIRDADQAKSVDLVRHGLILAEAIVKPNGFFLAKLFQGRDTDAFLVEVKEVFKDVKLLKPEATRDGSREVFVIARNRRPTK